MRLFVGLAPPAAVLDDLDAVCAPLRPAREDLRWTSRELWHITLAFLGEVSEESIDRLVPRLERAARRHLVFGLSLAGAGERAVERAVRRPQGPARPGHVGERGRQAGRCPAAGRTPLPAARHPRPLPHAR